MMQGSLRLSYWMSKQSIQVLIKGESHVLNESKSLIMRKTFNQPLGLKLNPKNERKSKGIF